MADKPDAVVMPSDADIKSVTYAITKKGRKWLEGIVPEKGYKARIAICPATASFEVGSTHTFTAGVVFKSDRYGSSVTVYPLDNEDAVAAAQEKDRQKNLSEIKRWLGYVEEKAPQGYLYVKGVRELEGLGISKYPEFNKRLAVAKRLVATQTYKYTISEYLGYIRNNLSSYWYTRGANKVLEAIAALKDMGEDVSDAEAKLDTLRQEYLELAEKNKNLAAEKRRQEETGGYEGPVFRLSGGSGYGCHGWTKGQIVRNSKQHIEAGEPEYLFVLSARKTYYREDGMSFGVGDEDGYVYGATAREATGEESAPLREQEAQAAAVRQARTSLRQIAEMIRKTGECPTGTNIAAGEELDMSPAGVRIYGGGEWFVIGPEFIWYAQNNGADGDNWSCNNVCTCGAGAIGWRVPFDGDLAARIRSLYSAAGRS